MASFVPGRSCRSRPFHIFGNPAFILSALASLGTSFAQPVGGTSMAELGRPYGLLRSGGGTAGSQRQGAGGTVGDDKAAAMNLELVDADLEIKEDTRIDISQNHPGDNINDGLRLRSNPKTSARTAPTRVVNKGADNPSVDTSEAANTRDKIEKEKKGRLGSIYTLTDKLYQLCLSLFVPPILYILYQMAQGSKMDIWAPVFFTGGFIPLIPSILLVRQASHWKDSESIDCIHTGSFKWLLLFVSQYIYLIYSILLVRLVLAQTSRRIPWPLVIIIIAVIGSAALLLYWFWYFHINWPKVMEEMTKWDV